MRKYFILQILFFISVSVIAQSGLKVSAVIDSSKLMIGDQVKLKLVVEKEKGVQVQWPLIPDTIGKIEVLEKSKIDTFEEKGITRYRQVLNLTAFDSGYYAIAPFQFRFKKENDTSNFLAETAAFLLSVYVPKVDTTKAIRDIKQPLDVPFTFQEALPYIIGFLILAVIFWLAYYIYLKRKKGQKIFEPFIPTRPAHEIAIENLKKLENEKLWQIGKFKLYHSELSDIVRTYIEGRFGVRAMEQTSEEIISSFKRNQITQEQLEKLTQLLKLADLVKFAKVEPLPNENDFSLKNAYSFVESTVIQKPEEPVIESKSNLIE